MPPSGYSQFSITSFVAFLKEALSDLKGEVAQRKYPSLEAGLSYEIFQIETVRNSPELRPCEQGALLATKDFYKLVLAHGEEQALVETMGNITSLHINSEGKLVRRT